MKNFNLKNTYFFDNNGKMGVVSHICTVGATRLARVTALARSLSNTNMEMFYKDFRLDISTD